MSLEEEEFLVAENKELKTKVAELEKQLAWLKRQYFGRKSEKLAHLNPNQLSLFDEPFREQIQAIEAAKEAAEKQIKESTQDRKKERQVRKMLEGLPVVEVVIEPEGIDPTKYKRIGEERTRTLEFEPGKLFVKEIVRPKYGLKDNTELPELGKSGVLIAPLPLLPIYKGLPGASLLSEILLQKYEYHVPFYRQIQSFRHLGVQLSESTLNGWFKPACELLRPLYEALKEETLKADYIQVDETTLPVVDNRAHQAKKEYLWVVRSVPDGATFFHYQDGSRSTETVEKLLTSFKGYLQSDGYQAYNVFKDKDGVCLVGCMAHVRRYFEQALGEHKALAEYALSQIQNLYKVERMADNDKLTLEQRAELRRRLAAPIMDAMELWMEKTYPSVLPKSRMGQAIGYTYSLWPRMKTYLKDGRLKIDNNGAENAIRPIALGRKNYLFCGNHEAAENTAVICSLLATCKARDVNPREWLNQTIEKLPYVLETKSREELIKLLPKPPTLKNSNNTLTKYQERKRL